MNTDQATQARHFHIGDVLTVTTGMLLSPRGMDGVYDILNFLTGENLCTHQLPRALKEVVGIVYEQHPQLAQIGATEMLAITSENVHECVAQFGKLLGETLALTPAPAGTFTPCVPLTVMMAMGSPRMM